MDGWKQSTGKVMDRVGTKKNKPKKTVLLKLILYVGDSHINIRTYGLLPV